MSITTDCLFTDCPPHNTLLHSDHLDCDYPMNLLYKATSRSLRSVSPHAYFFLRQLHLSNSDIDHLLGDLSFNEEYLKNYPNQDDRYNSWQGSGAACIVVFADVEVSVAQTLFVIKETCTCSAPIV